MGQHNHVILDHLGYKSMISTELLTKQLELVSKTSRIHLCVMIDGQVQRRRTFRELAVEFLFGTNPSARYFIGLSFLDD